MKNIRLSIIVSSLMLCAWLTASFTAQNLPASPLNAPSQSTKADSPSTKAVATDQKEIKEVGIAAPVVLIK